LRRAFRKRGAPEASISTGVPSPLSVDETQWNSIAYNYQSEKSRISEKLSMGIADAVTGIRRHGDEFRARFGTDNLVIKERDYGRSKFSIGA
jgi:hypothetical protein